MRRVAPALSVQCRPPEHSRKRHDMNETTMAEPVVPAMRADALDAVALERYLCERIDGLRGPLSIRRFEGGESNPTYRVDAQDGHSYVLRRKPPGVLLPSAHAVDREFRVQSALAQTGVPVSRCHLLCEDPSVIGTMFYVMDYMPGRVFFDPSLPGIAPAERGAMYDELIRVLATLHGVDYEAAGLSTFGKPGNYFARQIDRWTKQYRASQTESIAAMERLIEWLPQNIPAGDATCIVHGDYRLDNVIFHASEPRIVAVLDWELATLGHPMADLSYHLMAWRLAPDEFRGLRGHDLESLGIPTEDAYLDRYFAHRGGGERPGEREWHFYLAYNMFRLSAILQGIMARALQGNAAGGARAHDTGRRAGILAAIGWNVVEELRASN
jgi:aminoglycoside phosphotransferase (APT) family kinase protein